MIMEDEAEKRKEGYFEEERGRKRRTNRANVLTDALAEKQGLPLRNQASNPLGKARLRHHLNQSGKAFIFISMASCSWCFECWKHGKHTSEIADDLWRK